MIALNFSTKQLEMVACVSCKSENVVLLTTYLEFEMFSYNYVKSVNKCGSHDFYHALVKITQSSLDSSRAKPLPHLQRTLMLQR